jgi:nicotinamidase-related amidase
MTKLRATTVAIGIAFAATASQAPAQTIVEEWSAVKPPPPPQLKPVQVQPKETALLMLDFMKQNCLVRPRCVASVPKAQALLKQARDKGMHVVYSVAGQPLTDVLPEVAPRQDEPSVSSGPDKFLNTELDKILKEKGVKTVIVIGSAAEGAVLQTGSSAALRGYKVIVPVDGASSSTTYAEQYTAWHLGNAPRVGTQVTLTRLDQLSIE